MNPFFSAFDNETSLVRPSKKMLDLVYDAFESDREGNLQFVDWVRLVRAALTAKVFMDTKQADECCVSHQQASGRAEQLARQLDWGILGQQTTISKENFRIGMDGPIGERLLTVPIIQLMLHKRHADALKNLEACMDDSIQANYEHATREAATAMTAEAKSAEVLEATATAVDLTAGTVRRYERMYENHIASMNVGRTAFYENVEKCVDKLVGALDTVKDDELREKRKQKIRDAQELCLPTNNADDPETVEPARKKRSLGWGTSTPGTSNANGALGPAFNSNGRSNAPETPEDRAGQSL